MASLISFFVTLKQGHRYFSPLISEYQGRGSVYSGCQFGIQHIEAFGVVSEELKFADQILCVLLLFPLFFYKPVQKLHGTEILYRVCSIVNVMNQAGHIALVLQACMEGLVKGVKYLVRLGYGLQ